MLKKSKTLTYISLFSSAGVGCYGFKKAGFECVATNELIERRLNVQKSNNKCMFESGYICGDITQQSTKELITQEIKKWEKLGNDSVDVLIATPPCQGMSVANHKKKNNEIERNSLVVESIEIINQITPKIFIFENVSAFMKTGCTTKTGDIKAIGDVIYEELGKNYTICSRILNFKNYGSNSSRTRTIVIGVHNLFSDNISPISLYPNYRKEKTIKEVIGNLIPLEWGEFDPNDFYHQFRTYPIEMRKWIHDLDEGKSAFDNEDPLLKPHKIIDGEIVINQQKNGDKYTRQCWNKVAPCIHTRNDQLASQNTIHPSQDRVFSIRELMMFMSIPNTFKWLNLSLEELNDLDLSHKKEILKKHEINIRQSIGEAVPTNVFYEIAIKINNNFKKEHIKAGQYDKLINELELDRIENLLDFIDSNREIYDVSSLSRLAELANSKRENNAAYFTNPFIVNEISQYLPDTSENEISILEPSVGVGNFIPMLFKKYDYVKKVKLDLVDIDENSLLVAKKLIDILGVPENFEINFINANYLEWIVEHRYFLIVGNPPFSKLSKDEIEKLIPCNINKITHNCSEFFLEKSLKNSQFVVSVMPKNLLNVPEYAETRKLLNNYEVSCIQDFGERGFKGVLVETICIFINTQGKPKSTIIESKSMGIRIIQNQKYYTDPSLPYWVIYRNHFFDDVFGKLEFDVFSSFRDRQITNSNTCLKEVNNSIRVIKSRNISDDGTEILDIPDYDSFIDINTLKKLVVYKYINEDNVYLTPNMSYKPRVMKKRKGYVVNGSVAILIPKSAFELSDNQMKYFSSEEYRSFYMIARNYQTRSLNIDNLSAYWFGKLKEE